MRLWRRFEAWRNVEDGDDVAGMNHELHSFRGSCHCGCIGVDSSLSWPAEVAPVRSCDCSFCRSHGARTVTDPGGCVVFHFDDTQQVQRYRFAFKTADFLICKNCGVYVGAIARSDDRLRATLNVNVLAARSLFDPNPPSVSYDGETADARLARRAKCWTPACLD